MKLLEASQERETEEGGKGEEGRKGEREIKSGGGEEGANMPDA